MNFTHSHPPGGHDCISAKLEVEDRRWLRKTVITAVVAHLLGMTTVVAGAGIAMYVKLATIETKVEDNRLHTDSRISDLKDDIREVRNKIGR